MWVFSFLSGLGGKRIVFGTRENAFNGRKPHLLVFAANPILAVVRGEDEFRLAIDVVEGHAGQQGDDRLERDVCSFALVVVAHVDHIHDSVRIQAPFVKHAEPFPPKTVLF